MLNGWNHNRSWTGLITQSQENNCRSKVWEDEIVSSEKQVASAREQDMDTWLPALRGSPKASVAAVAGRKLMGCRDSPSSRAFSLRRWARPTRCKARCAEEVVEISHRGQ